MAACHRGLIRPASRISGCSACRKLSQLMSMPAEEARSQRFPAIPGRAAAACTLAKAVPDLALAQPAAASRRFLLRCCHMPTELEPCPAAAAAQSSCGSSKLAAAPSTPSCAAALQRNTQLPSK